jgi:anion-transporting  ArsA/GET3 family ATPase
MQQHYLKVAEETFRLPIFKVPMLPSEPAGKDALDRVGRELLGEERTNMVSVMGMMMGRKGGDCCG